MAKYKEYKEFIPKSFEEKNTKLQEKGKKKGKLLLIILNFILLPLNINGIKEKSLEGKVNKSRDMVVEEGVSAETIEKWLDINQADFLAINIEKGKGRITVEDLKAVNDIEKAGFKINSLKEDNKGYIVEIEN